MRLTKPCHAIFDTVPCLNKDLCNLIGVFAGSALPLKKDQFYCSLSPLASKTFIHSDHFHLAMYFGENKMIHMWKIIRTTPYTYVVQYQFTRVFIHAHTSVVYQFRTKINSINRCKRFFPLRNKYDQHILHEYMSLPFYDVQGNADFKRAGHHFLMTLQTI